MNNISSYLIDLLYPPDAVCIVCGGINRVEGRMCEDCASELRTIEDAFPLEEYGRCRVCSRPVPLGRTQCASCARDATPAYGFAPFMHTGTAARLVSALKFQNQAFAARILAPYLLRYIPEGTDALVPIPLHRLRERERGFNQAALLCGEMSRSTGLPSLSLLIRERNTKRQSDLSGDARTLNVAGSFTAADPSLDLRGMNIALVDDVRTTGSTALFAMNALLTHGAGRVTLLTATLSKH